MSLLRHRLTHERLVLAYGLNLSNSKWTHYSRSSMLRRITSQPLCPISLPILSVLRLMTQNFPGHFIWTWSYHPLNINILLESNPLKSRINLRTEIGPTALGGYPQAHTYPTTYSTGTPFTDWSEVSLNLHIDLCIQLLDSSLNRRTYASTGPRYH